MKTIIITTATTTRNNEISLYFKECNKYAKELTTTQIAELQRKGDYDAIVTANMKFGVSIAKQYQGMGLELADLIQAANIGLVVAAREFNVSRGTSFTTLAVEYIRKYINEELTNNSRTVRMGAHLVKGKAINRTNSMDAPLSDDEGEKKCYGDTFASSSRADELTHADDMRKTIAHLMRGLDEREKAVIVGLFALNGKEESENTLAMRYGLTTERIRQIKWEALKKIKEMAK